MFAVMIFDSNGKLEEEPKFFEWRVDARTYARTKGQSAEYAEIYDADGVGKPGDKASIKLISNLILPQSQ